ncbi:hypothetical protein BKA70DRAFT_1218579 [Coprinopsis sp. MPI-PUGE-AT-0042]|nr:hypothetical protein BKA70DRAFT_1218579 [Coprinopsis sp. MPI-PUGE-AT-0042]
MTSTSESLPRSANTPAFSIKLTKKTSGPDVLLYEELKLDLTDGTQALHRQVTVPSPWGGGNFVYVTDTKEGPHRSESSITNDSQVIYATCAPSKATREKQGNVASVSYPFLYE